eukprot:COSAG03_NODE_302_length_9200_cov_3.491704_7_plen_77_part_00
MRFRSIHFYACTYFIHTVALHRTAVQCHSRFPLHGASLCEQEAEFFASRCIFSIRPQPRKEVRGGGGGGGGGAGGR